MNEIERRNSTYDAFVKMTAWVSENAKGLWDERQKFCVSVGECNRIEFELNILPSGKVFICKNLTNYSDNFVVAPDGFHADGYDYVWDRCTGKWKGVKPVPSHKIDRSTYAINGMFGMANRWQDIKKWISIRKENCNAVLNFEV